VRQRQLSRQTGNETKPTDPQIAHIAYTAGEIDIKAAKQALAKSRNKEVRAFRSRWFATIRP
jgi:predicted outer membrane protein